eukprot:scaffold23116_cov103-Isochrysis_galbana.AAC.10
MAVCSYTRDRLSSQVAAEYGSPRHLTRCWGGRSSGERERAMTRSTWWKSGLYPNSSSLTPPSSPSKSHVFSTPESLPRAFTQRSRRWRLAGSCSRASRGTHWQWMCARLFHLIRYSSGAGPVSSAAPPASPRASRDEKILSMAGAAPPGTHAPGGSGKGGASSLQLHSSPSLTHAPSASTNRSNTT